MDDLENEINVYEYEDDEWLDESESLSGSHQDNGNEEEEEEKEEEEEVEDKTIEFEMKHIFIEELSVQKDVTLDFVYEKTSIYSDRKEKTAEFESAHVQVLFVCLCVFFCAVVY